MKAPLLSDELLDLLGHKPRLLIVDDQPLNIQGLHRVFADECQVFMATSGEQALRVCAERQPDLVLLDVVMPGMDGYETCVRIKNDSALAETPVIFVTAHNDADSETRGLECGAGDFISKPFNPAVVRARVRSQLQLKLQSDLLRRLAFIDGLTGLHNRRYFDERFASELQRARRNDTSLALALIDVDYFKRYNDRYGHQSGDDCLRAVAVALRTVLKRPGDVVCRYGGEEFACLLPETDVQGAHVVAEQLQQAVRTLGVAHDSSDAAQVVTISQGIVVGVPGAHDDTMIMLTRVDTELYRAKKAGRDRYSLAELGASATAEQLAESEAVQDSGQ
jgi:diguanylate cyclase (GGDEF)-like protein